MNIKTLLKNKPFCNELHFFLFGLVLTILSVFHTYLVILPIFYMVFIYRKTKLFIPILATILVFLLSLVIQRSLIRTFDNEIFEGEFTVVEVDEKYLILKEEIKVIVYSDEIKLIPGDIIKTTLKLSELNTGSFKGDFDSKSYYQSKRIYCSGKLEEYEVIGHKYTLNRVKYLIKSFYKMRLNDRSYQYLDALIFGNNDLISP